MTQKMKLFTRVFLILSALYAGSVPAEEWNVGFMTIGVSDSVVDYDIEVAIWYPTEAKVKGETIGPTTLQVAKGAQPLVSSQNLILISHGFSGNYLGHNDTAQFLARLGYVVATPTHPDLQGLRSGNLEFDPLVARPRHIQLIIDELLNHPLFGANLNQNHIGIIGFSLGTYSVLTALGATPDFSGLRSYCAIKTQDVLLCSPQARQRFVAIESNLVLLGDNRIGGAVLLAPAYGPVFPEKSLADIATSVQLFSAENDQEIDNRYNAQYFKESLPNIASIEILKDAGHFTFMAPCSEELKRTAPFICRDAEAVDRVMVHRKLNRDIAKFFKTVLD